MNRGACARARPHFIHGTRVIAIGEQNASDTVLPKLLQVFTSWFDRIDAEVASRLANQVTVEVVAVRFRKPRPGEDTG